MVMHVQNHVAGFVGGINYFQPIPYILGQMQFVSVTSGVAPAEDLSYLRRLRRYGH